MTSRLTRSAFLMAGCAVFAAVAAAPSARALDTPNVLMAIDGMTINHAGLFRNAPTNEGVNTFVFFSFAHQPGHVGRYKSFYLYDQNVNPDDPQNFGGISHNARYHSDTPEFFNQTQFSPAYPLDLTNDYYPIIDRGSFGQIFDPAEYQIEVKFKPILAADPFPIKNDAHTFNVGLDQIDGFVWDAEAGSYKRANDAFTFTIGTEELGINDWYATAPKDADGFATYIRPLTPNAIGRGYYYLFGDNPFQAAHVVTGNGRVQNADLTWSDVDDGLDPLSFGGGATDPSRPNSQLRVPNGVPLMSITSAGQGPDEIRQFSVEVRSAALKRIAPNPIMARVDANSGLTFRFGDELSYSTVAEAGASTPITINGFPFVPNYTNQISRFDQNGMTNLIINARSGPDATGYSMFIRTSPGAESFDATNAMVNIRAKLTEPLTNPGVAQSMTIYARELDGSDTNSDTVVGPVVIPADPKGADQYNYSLALNQFNTSTFTTISVPMSAFTLNNLPFGFTNPGDGLLTDFNLYEFGLLVPNGGGLVRLELEYMELRVPPSNDSDFDDDNDVDGSDFLIWQRGVGSVGTATNGDANGDGLVNGADLTIIKAHFGGPPSPAGAVPEPASVALAAVMAAAFGLRRRRA